MSIVDGTGLVTWEGMLFEPGSELLAATRWVFNYVRERGATITGNEAGRPFGVYSDRYVRNASETASGISTVHYQWGRYLRGETPSAADPAGGPYASDHTKGIATDTNCSDIAIRREAMRLVGMVQTILAESWHFAKRGPALVDLTGWADIGSSPIDNTPEDDMFTDQDRQDLADLRNRVITIDRTVRANADDETREQGGVKLQPLVIEDGKPERWFLINVEAPLDSPLYRKKVELGPGRLDLVRRYFNNDVINAAEFAIVMDALEEVKK